MAPGLRKLVLTAHVSSSVGWLGAIGAFLALAIPGLIARDDQTVQAAYLGMRWIALFVLVPLSLASLLTGLVQSLGTEWGLFRHYWVLAKLLINVLANVVLLLFVQRLSSSVYVGSDAPVLHAGVALVLLLMATMLSVYKPRGVTPHGWRKRQERRRAALQRAVQQAPSRPQIS